MSLGYNSGGVLGVIDEQSHHLRVTCRLHEAVPDVEIILNELPQCSAKLASGLCIVFQPICKLSHHYGGPLSGQPVLDFADE